MRARKFKSNQSLWFIDEDLQRFMRLPLEERPAHSDVPYGMYAHWHDFSSVQIHEGHLRYVQPVSLSGEHLDELRMSAWEVAA